MTETLIPLYQLGSLPRLVFALFFAGSPQSLSEYPTLLFLLDHVLLISYILHLQKLRVKKYFANAEVWEIFAPMECDISRRCREY